MIYRQIAVACSCIVLLFCSAVLGETELNSTGIVHAYRKPSEDDLKWLFGENNTSETNGGIVQMNATVTDLAHPIVQMAINRLPPPAEAPRELDIAVPMKNSPAEPPPVWDERKQLFDISTHTGCNGNPENPWPCICLTCIICGDHRQNQEHARSDSKADKANWIFQLDEAFRKRQTNHHVPNMLGSNAWLTGYSVGTTGNSATQFTLPTMLLSRPNVSEHFNADPQNRIWADFRHWNNAVSMNGESRGVEQFSFGLETRMLGDNSIELRFPVFYQFDSDQIDAATSTELGNVSVLFKYVFSRNLHWTTSYGGGITLPTAKNWQPIPSARLKNDLYYLFSFVGIQWHPDKETFGQFVLQYDVPIKNNELSYFGNSAKVTGQQVLRSGLQLGRWIYCSEQDKRPCRFGVFAEINYVLVTKGSAGNNLSGVADGIFVSDLHLEESALTAALGVPMVFGKLTCTNSFVMPIPLGDYPFSVGYSFSLSRQF